MIFLLPLLNLSIAHEVASFTTELVKEQVPVYPQVVKLHPPVVHFAVSLPFATLISALYFMLREKRLVPLVGLFSFITFFSLVLAVGTGYLAHQRIADIPIQTEAIELLHLHQRIGFFLLFVAFINFAIALLYTYKRKLSLAYLFLVVNLLFCAGVLYQGSLGGKLVYGYSVGVPVK